MQPSQTMIFTCQACGHQFQSAREVVSRQPTCPRCRTYGKIAGPDGVIVGASQQVVKVAHPGARGGPVAGPARRGPAAAQPQDDEPVMVSADVAYGKKNNAKTIATVAILVGVGISTLVVLWILVSAFKGNAAEEARQKKEVVQDPQDFEKSIGESINKVRTRLKNVPGATVTETMNFGDAINIIVNSGGATPSWTEPPRPGSPFKAVGFMITGKEMKGKLDDAGFVVILYYKTADETTRAAEDIRRQIGEKSRNFSITVNAANWYVAYSGETYLGPIHDALTDARTMAKPITKQVSERVGATYKGKATDG